MGDLLRGGILTFLRFFCHLLKNELFLFLKKTGGTNTMKDALCSVAADNGLFSLENVDFIIEDQTILSNITVDIDSEGVTGIIGPSGSGKSTFLRLLNKLHSPTQGVIYFKGVNLKDLPTQQLRKEVGLVQQKPYLFEGTVRDNLAYGPKLWEEPYTTKDFHEVLKRVALTPEFLDRRINNLSVGEQQRVSLARTLTNDPCTLLLDEPTSGLDVASEEIIEDTLHELREEGVKIIIVTHSLEQTKRLTDQVLFLKEGQLTSKTSTERFFDRNTPATIRKYFKRER